jgi:hypothetical protein
MCSGSQICRNSGPIKLLEGFEVVLLPTILRILDQHIIQPKIVEKPKAEFKAELAAAVEGMSRPENIEAETSNAAELLNPPNSEPQSPDKSAASSNMEELLRTITKFEKSNESRVVDVFE